jgi:hypothetical protein
VGFFAITHGRLHAIVTKPWIRPPGPGEPYLVVRAGTIDDTKAPPTIVRRPPPS